MRPLNIFFTVSIHLYRSYLSSLAVNSQKQQQKDIKSLSSGTYFTDRERERRSLVDLGFKPTSFISQNHAFSSFRKDT